MEDFFRRVLPGGGQYSILALGKGKPRDLNGIDSLERLVSVVTALSTHPLDLYYAVGTFEGTRSLAHARLKRAVWLDLDAKDFGSKAQARAELDIFLRTTGIPAPAILVDSGGGWHVYWPLDRDIGIEEWRELAGALKARCIECEFQADHGITADAARVLRIPGTLNHKYGTPLPCSVVHDTGQVFDSTQLLHSIGLPKELPVLSTPVGDISINDALSLDTAYVPPSTHEVQSMLSAINIPAQGSARRDTWLTILAGLHHWSQGSEEGFGIADSWSAGQPAYRSSADVHKTWDSFGQSSDFGRREVTIATIIKFAKDAGWKPAPVISDEEEEIPLIDINAAGFRATAVSAATGVPLPGVASTPIPRTDDRLQEATRRGRKQLTKEEAIMELAGNFIYVENQGTYYSQKIRNVLDKIVISDMYTWAMPVSGSGTPVDPCTMLKNSVNVRQVRSMGFHPGQGMIYEEGGIKYVNRYSPPPVEITPSTAEMLLIKDLLDYLFPTAADQAFKKYYMQFLAHMVQRPGVKIATAMLFISEKYGIGKTTAAFTIPSLLAGTQNTRVVTNDILSRPFTAYLGESHFLHLQEVHVNGKWNSDDTANRLKGIITDATVNVHRKGFDDYDIPNRVVVTATSNYKDAMYISSNQERRWGVYELNPARGYTEAQHRKYFDLVHRFLSSPRAAGVLRYIFMRLSLAGFNPQTPPPMTIAKARMQTLSMSEEAQIIHDAYYDQRAPFHKDIFVIEDVRALLQIETGKLMSTKKVANLTHIALPTVKQLPRMRAGNTGERIRLWCTKNAAKWETANLEEVRAELMRI